MQRRSWTHRQPPDGIGEHLCPVFVVAKHVETGASRRQQYSIAGLRLLGGKVHRLLEVSGRQLRQIGAGDGLADQWSVAADQHYRTGVAGNRPDSGATEGLLEA